MYVTQHSQESKLRINSLDNKMNMNMTPVQMLQRFYNDYNRVKLYATIDTNQKYKKHKTNQTEKMTKFLNTYQRKQPVNDSTLNTESHMISNTKYKSMTPSRHRHNESQEPKRCYFKSVYTQAHPFLTTHHNIRQKNIQEPTHVKTEPVQTLNIQFIQNFKLMTPLQNRKSVRQLKQKLVHIKNNKKERMEKVRYNFLVHNEFKGQKIMERHENLIRNSKIRFSQTNTKQRIFPNSTQMARETNFK